MNRAEMLARAVERREPWDMVIVGGGASGLGVAVDAAARGYEVLLLERADFGSGTSSRSTKLVHGGVRYLRQGHVGLVLDALRERGRLLRNAPHLVRELDFVIPCYGRWERAYYAMGLKAYDLLAGRHGFGRSYVASPEEARRLLPNVRTEGLRGGVVYRDGQFDDARLLVHLAMTAAGQGAAILNYAGVVAFTHSPSGDVTGVVARDAESGGEFRAASRIVVNAAGPFCDAVRRMADPAVAPLVAASRGSHVVLDDSFLPGENALLVPKTADGRVLFAVPWHGRTLVGTTDVAIPVAPAEPRPTEEEIAYMLETAGRYLERPPRRGNVRSAFAGVRPLLKSGDGKTAALSRDYALREDRPGLLTLTGGKWTTYRSMAEACVDRAAEKAGLPKRPCPTAELSIHGYCTHAGDFGSLSHYGSDAPSLRAMIERDQRMAERLHHGLPYVGAEVVWAARTEMARTLEDVLARRLRALFLDAGAAAEMAPRACELLAGELGRDGTWARHQSEDFKALAVGYGAPI